MNLKKGIDQKQRVWSGASDVGSANEIHRNNLLPYFSIHQLLWVGRFEVSKRLFAK